jgi:hypothetical protein
VSVSLLDFVLVILLVAATILYGRLSVQGQVVAVLSMYVGLAIASKYYLDLGLLVADQFPRSSPELLQMATFLMLIMLVMAVALVLQLLITPGRVRVMLTGGMRRYQSATHLAIQEEQPDPRNAGVLVPLLRAVMAVGLSLTTAAILLMVAVALSRTQYAEYAPWVGTLRGTIDSSFLGPLLLRAVPYLALSVRLWSTGGVAPVFNV